MKLFKLVLTLSFFTAGPAFAYDQVQVEKVVPLTAKKSEPSILRIDKGGRLWVLDQKNSSIDQINLEGKIEVILKPGKKNEDLFKSAVDFNFLNNGTMIVSDAGLNRIAIIAPADVEGSTSSKESSQKNLWAKAKLHSRFAIENPGAISVSRDDIIAVGNNKDKNIQVYSLDGVHLHTLFPPMNNEFKAITSLAYSQDGLLWALDGETGRLHRFSSDRKWLGATEGLPNAQAVQNNEFGFAYVSLSEGRWVEIDREGKVTGTFGTKGKNPGQLLSPVGLALSNPFSLWVAEAGNNRLQLFHIINEDKQSMLLPEPAARLQVRFDARWPAQADFGAFDQNGNLLVMNPKKKQFEWLDSTGKVQSTWEKKGKEKGAVLKPAGVTVDPIGQIWITDLGEHNIKKVYSDGNVLKSVGTKGKKEGNLISPHLIQVRNDGSFIVSDKDDTRVQVLSKDGLFLFSVGSKGKNRGQFSTVSGLAANQNSIALIDNERKAFLLFDSKGKFILEMGNKEGTPPLWKDLVGLVSNEKGHYYVFDRGAKRVRLFDSKARYLGDFTSSGDQIICGPQNKVLMLSEKELNLYRVAVVPRALENLKVSDSEGDIKIEWDENAEAAQYRLYRSTTANEYLLHMTTAGSSALDVNVVPGVVYRYAVTGINDLGYEGNWVQSEPIKASRRKDVSLVSISSVTLEPIFSAAFKYYVNHPIGSITIQNYNDKPYRNVKLSLGLKLYTDFPTEKVIGNLMAGEILTVPVTMTFNDKILELSENTPIQADVRVSFFDENQEKMVSQNAPMTIYSRNAISWKDKNRIASFITPKDPPVVEFCRTAIKEHMAALKGSTVGKPLAKAALLYEAINALGIAYVPDPKTPYAEASKNPDILDYVQFPRETLRRRTGDCDDTTALLGSLLESIGVDVALVDTPGHIFLMANLEENNPSLIGLPIERFVEFKGTYWVPIETTKLGKDFLEAWQTGINTIKTAKEKDQVLFIRVFDAAEHYPPVTILEADNSGVPFPSEKLDESFPKILEQLQSERYKNRLAMIKEQIKDDPENGMLEIKMGIIHTEGGNVGEARKIFDDLLKHQSSEVQSAAHNNLGNISYLSGDYKAALSQYDDAAILSPDDGGISINRARAAWKLGDNASAKKYLTEARDQLSDWTEYAGDFPAEILPK